MKRLVVGLWYPVLAGVAIYIRTVDHFVWSTLGSQVWYVYIATLVVIGSGSMLHFVVEQIDPDSLLADLEADMIASLWTMQVGIMHSTSFGSSGNGHNIIVTKF